ncbi:MAG TPA: hypothetical protein VGN88_10100, partial [Phycisphaerae bacterium]
MGFVLGRVSAGALRMPEISVGSGVMNNLGVFLRVRRVGGKWVFCGDFGVFGFGKAVFGHFWALKSHL